MNIITTMLQAFPLVIIFSLTSYAQTDELKYYLDEFVIPATEEEQSLLHDAETLNWSKTQSLYAEVDRLKKEIKSLMSDEKMRVDELLTPEQKQAIGEQRLASTRERVAANTIFLRDFSIFAQQIAKSEKFDIFEGLPRGKLDDIAKIKASSETFAIDGFDFYSDPLIVDFNATEKLRGIFIDYQRFSPTSAGGKFCGGFHPDLLLKFTVDGSEYRVHVCTGCYEIMNVGPNQKFNFDYNLPARDEIVEIAKSIMIHSTLVHP